MDTLSITSDWTDTDDYNISYAETSDPRILAVIKRDENAEAPSGDALAPSYWLDYPRAPRHAGDTFHDEQSDTIAAAWQNVHAYAVNAQYDRKASRRRAMRDYDTFTDRYLRIFHNARAVRVWGGANGGDSLLIIDTPNYREHIGEPALGTHPETDGDYLKGEASEWKAYLDGDVYGIGWATLAVDEDERSEEIEISTEWVVEMQCWGFYGESYAKESAATFDAGVPEIKEPAPVVPLAERVEALVQEIAGDAAKGGPGVVTNAYFVSKIREAVEAGSKL